MARRQQLKARVIDGTRVRSKTYTVDSLERTTTRTDLAEAAQAVKKPTPKTVPPPTASVSTPPPTPDPKPRVVPTPSTARLLQPRPKRRKRSGT
jgi:hypothetical protein